MKFWNGFNIIKNINGKDRIINGKRNIRILSKRVYIRTEKMVIQDMEITFTKRNQEELEKNLEEAMKNPKLQNLVKHLGWSNNGTFFCKTTVTEFILFMLFLFGALFI